MTVRVLIVDDHEPFRVWAAKVLRAGGMDVVGEAATAARALVAGARLRPDVVLLDIRLPDADGFTVCRALCATGLTVVLCSALTARDYGDRVERSPAVGFLPKHRLSAAALRLALDG
jgi:DNA-binding NarL/FixJ family response regulator